MSTTLGLVETFGLPVAITAADAAAKSANVRILDYELTKGSGLVTVKFEGDVAAVKAALDAAVAAASRVGKVYSKLVIPRPSNQLHIFTDESEDLPIEETSKQEEKNRDQVEEVNSAEVASIDERDIPETETDVAPIQETNHANEGQEKEMNSEEQPVTVGIGDQEELVKKELDEVCNICHDPTCPRRKGDLRSLCIHYND
ncbi:BMC domain-containing protein [Oceanobacillus halophilus]|uniref:BMC domain-containing protein n=1 Tax=Oceanobacillus halophilus TaxID=930130 RepID=A0A494ZUE5_9BACI|nr:BMC domain-containing protein [Oceanobacillus halophilus]RKQ29253.1 BMC domain-containing protein [Oceanobacillus halophilus]